MSEYRMIVRADGGPDVIERETFVLSEPGPGEAIVRHAAIGLNFIDIYHRVGLYPVPRPTVLGSEGAGTVEQIGEGVTEVRPGDRVAYMGGPLGAYASVRAIPAKHLVPLPDAIGFDVAAAAMLKGLTADMLVGSAGEAKPGQIVLVHSAVGGVGSIAVQWLKAIGATVIAHVGNEDKATKARALGADHALSCEYDSLAEEVRALTGGHGADLILDGVGKASWAASLACAAKCGLILSYGNASGPAPAFTPLELGRAGGGSLFVGRPGVFSYTDTRDSLLASAGRLFALIADGSIVIEIGQAFPLDHAGDAHRALEARQTTGSTVLLP